MSVARGLPGVASGDRKTHSPFSAGHKQIGHEVVPGRNAKAQLTGGDVVQRTIGNYAKQSPASVTGVGNSGQTINTMPGMMPR